MPRVETASSAPSRLAGAKRKRDEKRQEIEAMQPAPRDLPLSLQHAAGGRAPAVSYEHRKSKIELPSAQARSRGAGLQAHSRRAGRPRQDPAEASALRSTSPRVPNPRHPHGPREAKISGSGALEWRKARDTQAATTSSSASSSTWIRRRDGRPPPTITRPRATRSSKGHGCRPRPSTSCSARHRKRRVA